MGDGIFIGSIGIQISLIIGLIVGIRQGILKKGLDVNMVFTSSIIIILSCIVLLLST